MTDTIQINSESEVYTSILQPFIDQFIDKHDIEDLRKEPQSLWNACLYYIYKNYIELNADRLLKDDSKTDNRYDIVKVSVLLDDYINCCQLYDKEISILGFSRLTGIDQDTFYTWGNGERLNNRGYEIYKKLSQYREESLSDRLYSGKANPVGILGILNRHYGWNMGQPRGSQQEQKKTTEQIAEKYKDVQALPPPDIVSD